MSHAASQKFNIWARTLNCSCYRSHFKVYTVLSLCCTGRSHFCAQMRLYKVSKCLLKVPSLLDVGWCWRRTGEEGGAPSLLFFSSKLLRKRQEAVLKGRPICRRDEKQRRVPGKFQTLSPLAHPHTHTSLQRTFIIWLFPLRGRDCENAGQWRHRNAPGISELSEIVLTNTPVITYELSQYELYTFKHRVKI